jgi:hypothetical protein
MISPRALFPPGWHPWCVLLSSSDGACVELRVTGYQFPGREPAGHLDWDDDWLTVRGDISQRDGKSWTFEEPCLTTWEARALGEWLRDVADGTPQDPRHRADEPGAGEPEAIFTEPNLGLTAESRAGDLVSVRVYFSLEALPPWTRGDGQSGLYGYSLLISLAPADLADAAESWLREVALYPDR